MWQETYRVNVHDTDVNRVVSAGALMRYMQDTANLQMEGQSPSYLELFDKGYAFVLSRFRLEILAPVFWHEELLSETWAIPSKGYSYLRGYCLKRKGQIVAKADSVWALLALPDGKPVPVGEIPLNYEEGPAVDLPMEPRTRIPRDQAWQWQGVHRVGYLETDVNGHMNNTYYPDMFLSLLPMINRRVSSFSINYLTPALQGVEVQLMMGEKEGVFYGRSLLPDGRVNAECSFTLLSEIG